MVKHKKKKELTLKCRKDKSVVKAKRQRGVWFMGRVKESGCWVEAGLGMRYDLDGTASTIMKFYLKPWCKNCCSC